jgi:PAS domain S-box-containing protein
MAVAPADAFVAGQRDVLERIAGGAPLAEVLVRIVRLVEQQADGMLCSILLLDPDHGCVRHGAAPSLPPAFRAAIDGSPIGPAAGSCGTAAYRGEPVVVEDIATDPLWALYRDLALPHGLRACWSSPVFSADRRVLGTFAMYYRQPRGPSDAEREWVAAATHLAAVAVGRDRTEQALRQSEARYRRIADTAREGIWLVDRAGRTLFANRRVAEMLGCDGADLAGRRLLDFVDEAIREETERELTRAVGEPQGQRDVRLRRVDGAELWTLASVSSVTDDAGAVVGTLLMLTDITERKAAETRVRQLGRLYAVSSSVNEAISRIREPLPLYEHACRIAVEQGLMRLAWVGLYDARHDRLVPVARSGADDGYVDLIAVGLRDGKTGGGPAARALRQGTPVVANDIASDPGFYWQAEALARGLRSCAAFPIAIGGRPIGVLTIYAERPGYFSDEEVRVLSALADDISFGVESAATEAERRRLVHDLGERVKELTVLHGAARLLEGDRPLGEALLAELVSLLPPGWQYPEICAARIEWGGMAAETPGWRDTPWTQSATFEGGGQRGRIAVGYLAARPAAAEGPFLAEERALLESLADMFGAHAERQHAQAALRRSLEDLRDANQRLGFHVRQMPLAYIVWSHDLVVTEWNPAAERIFGWTAAEAVGRHAFELMVPPEAQPLVERTAASLLAGVGDARHFVGEGVRRDGRRVVCEWFNAPLHDGAGRAIGYLSMASDVTERRKAQEERSRLETQLRQAQRIQSLGTLAGGIAHDFNNVLTAIIGNAEIAAGALPADHRAQRSLTHIRNASARATDLVRRILMFSRRQEPQRSLVRLPAIVDEALKLLRATLPAMVEIRTEFAPDLPGVWADATQVYQVVMNLGTNAAHAMGAAGGRVTVGLQTVRVDDTAARPLDLPAGSYVRLSVSDTGCGMDPATLERIFEPFFTTKPVGEGTGLGLSVVHGIMKSHDGAIAVESRPGAGATFHLYFPVADAGAVAAAASPATADPRGHGEHVLFVDDEEAVVYMTSRILERLGYRVTGLTDARQALDTFRARADDFDAVVTDLAMPGLPGLELAREVRRLRPDLPVVFTSGFVPPEDVAALRDLAPADLVLKPHTVTELAPTLNRLLYSKGTKTDTRGSGPTSRVM